MTELAVVDLQVSPFDTVELDASGRVEYDGGELIAIHEADAETTEYRVARFQFDGGGSTVELPDGAVVLGVEKGGVTALVPTEAYQVEEDE